MMPIQRNQPLKLQKQHNDYTCLLYSFAMVMGMDAMEVFASLPHDGSHKKRGIEIGHHVQELIDFAMSRGFHPVEIEADPVSIIDHETTHKVFEKNLDRLEEYLHRYAGVIMCRVGFNKPHAVAWHGRVYDPSKNDFRIEHIVIESFIALRIETDDDGVIFSQ